MSGLSGLDSEADGRSFALLDFDRDGWLDVVVVNANAPETQLFHNRAGRFQEGSAPGNRWIALRFRGANDRAVASPGRSNRDGYGARVEVDLGDATLLREHRGRRRLRGAEQRDPAHRNRSAGRGGGAFGALALGRRTGFRARGRRKSRHALRGCAPVARWHRCRDRSLRGSRVRGVGGATVAPAARAPLPAAPASPGRRERAALDLHHDRHLVRRLQGRAPPVGAPAAPLLARGARDRGRAGGRGRHGREVLADYVARHQPAYRMLPPLAEGQREAVRTSVEQALGREGLPASFLTDADGRVLDAFWGRAVALAAC